MVPGGYGSLIWTGACDLVSTSVGVSGGRGDRGMPAWRIEGKVGAGSTPRASSFPTDTKATVQSHIIDPVRYNRPRTKRRHRQSCCLSENAFASMNPGVSSIKKVTVVRPSSQQAESVLLANQDLDLFQILCPFANDPVPHLLLVRAFLIDVFVQGKVVFPVFTLPSVAHQHLALQMRELGPGLRNGLNISERSQVFQLAGRTWMILMWKEARQIGVVINGSVLS